MARAPSPDSTLSVRPLDKRGAAPPLGAGIDEAESSANRTDDFAGCEDGLILGSSVGAAEGGGTPEDSAGALVLVEELRGSISATGEIRTGGEIAGGFRLNCMLRKGSEVEGVGKIAGVGRGEGFFDEEAGGTA